MTTHAPCETALAMSRAATPAGTGQPAPSVARDVVALATRAPSLHNTQPWRWRIVSDDALELFAAHDRQLRVLDPRGRLMTLSLGAALHHAMVAARAVDRAVTVERFPVGGPPDLVARLHLGEVVHAGPAERIALSSLVARRTDRRPFSSWELPEDRLRHLGELAASYGVTTVRLDARQRVAVQRLVAAAAGHQEASPLTAGELAQWWGGDREDAGVPGALVPDRLLDPLGIGRCEGGALDVGVVDDCASQHTAVLALCHPDDGPDGWLATGEAMSAVWLEAVSEGLGMVPVSLPVEVAEVRDRLREDVLGLLAHPQLLLQVGWPHTASARLAPSPRRPLDDVIVP
ncbi:MAG: Acg family FMN-binding oxidoreductase [Nocardioides sp.]